MKVGFAISLMCCVLCGGCRDYGKDAQRKFVASRRDMDVSVSTNEVVQKGVSADVSSLRTDILMRLDKISRLWPTNIVRAYHEIESLQSIDLVPFFEEADFCRKYVSFFRDLRFDRVPLEDRRFYIGRAYPHLAHPLNMSARIWPSNLEFAYVFCADYITKLKSEYAAIGDLIENLPPLPELPPLHYPKDGKGLPLRFIATKEQKESLDLHFKRRGELDVLNRYKRYISTELEQHISRGLDSEYARQKISLIPEPRRTEVIKYIEEKIGRRMKWRE